jgi:uncharacterized protein
MSNQANKILPATEYIREDNGEFYLSGLQCKNCKSIFIGKRSTCGKCFSSNSLMEIKLGNTGKLYSYSIVHRSFPGVDVPYISAIVDLDGGGTIKGNLIGIDANPDNIKFDMQLKLIFKDALGRTDKDGNAYVSYFFEPI